MMKVRIHRIIKMSLCDVEILINAFSMELILAAGAPLMAAGAKICKRREEYSDTNTYEYFRRETIVQFT